MIKKVGSTEIKARHRLTCHCGDVELMLDLPDGIVDPRRCDCSLCRRRAAIVGAITLSQITIVKGADKLRRYQFHTNVAEHFFCDTCGIYTHHRRRSDPNVFGYNVGCLEGVNPFELGDVPVFDGVNHPSDQK
jgi:hypothetical protein